MEKRLNSQLTLLGIFALLVWSLPALEGSNREIEIWQQITRLGAEFFPPDLSIWRELLKALIETIRIATFATAIGSVLGFFLAILGTPTVCHRAFRAPIVFILAVVRSVPSLILAVLAVALVGVNSLAGVVALAVYSVGYLGRFFLDIFDQSDPRPAAWMRLHGADPVQIFLHAQWPNLKQAFRGKILWMWEYNIRSAAIIGYVGAGGIGLQLQVYQEYGQWNRFSTALIMILTIVLIFELVPWLFSGSARTIKNKESAAAMASPAPSTL